MIITIAFYCCVIFVTIFLGRERTKATIAVAEAQVKAAKRKRYNKLYETLTPYDVVFSYIQKLRNQNLNASCKQKSVSTRMIDIKTLQEPLIRYSELSMHDKHDIAVEMIEGVHILRNSLDSYIHLPVLHLLKINYKTDE